MGKKYNKNTASPTSVWKAEREKKLNKIYKCLCLFVISILVIIVTVAMYSLYTWSLNINEESTFWEFWSDQLTAIIMAIVAAIISETFIIIKFKKILPAIIVTIVLILIFEFGCFMSVKASDSKKPTAVTIEESKPPQYLLKQYNFDDDPFLDQLNEYCGEDKIAEEETQEKMADIIVKDMQNKKHDISKEQPDEYVNNVNIAIGRYDTYLYQYNRDKMKKGSEIPFFKEDRLNDLENAINSRITADQHFENSENRRLVSIYYKDKGDEYSRNSNVKEALECYEKSAIWDMKAFYSAVNEKNSNKINKIMEDYKKVIDGMNALNGVGEGRIIRMNNCYEAYQIVAEYFS